MEAYRNLVEKYPADRAGHNNLALAENHLGNFRAAEAGYDVAIHVRVVDDDDLFAALERLRRPLDTLWIIRGDSVQGYPQAMRELGAELRRFITPKEDLVFAIIYQIHHMLRRVPTRMRKMNITIYHSFFSIQPLYLWRAHQRLYIFYLE